MIVAVATAFWLGILTAISPCPMAANIAAISYVARHVDNRKRLIASSVLYVLGRSLVYTILSIIIVSALVSVPAISRWLQTTANRILGIVLILTGIILLELVKLPFMAPKPKDDLSRKLLGGSMWGSMLIGALFAMAFCPVSAAIFFGSLIPIALQNDSPWLLPGVYGFGTGLPVILLALLIAFGISYLGRILRILQRVELWARHITGALFILIGIYYTLTYLFEVI